MFNLHPYRGNVIYSVEGITVGVQLARSLFPAHLLRKMRPACSEVPLLSTVAFPSAGNLIFTPCCFALPSLQMIAWELWRGGAEAGRLPSPAP